MAIINAQIVSCPTCGAPLRMVDSGYGAVKCTFCGAEVVLNRDDTKDGYVHLSDPASNTPVASVKIPIGWDVKKVIKDYGNCTLAFPFQAQVDIANETGSRVSVSLGEGYTVTGMMGLSSRQVARSVQRDFVPVDVYLDGLAYSYASSMGMQIVSSETRELPLDNPIDPIEKYNQYAMKVRKQMQDAQATSGATFGIRGMYRDYACKVYHLSGESNPVIAMYTNVTGNKVGLGSLGAGFGAVGDLFGTMFGAFKNAGSKFVNNVRNKNNGMQNNGMPQNNYGFQNGQVDNRLFANDTMAPPQPQENPQPVQPAENQMGNQFTPLFGNLNHPGQFEVLNWQSNDVFILFSDENEFENVFEGAFKQICSTFAYHPAVESELEYMRRQFEAQENAQVEREKLQQQQNFQRMQQAHAMQQQAQQSYIDSMMKNSNDMYQHNRASYNSRMAAEDRMSDMRSEAIRGVNTYIRPDGSEVEVSVANDTAWINGRGDIVGGSAGFDPGYGWTQMDKKY